MTLSSAAANRVTAANARALETERRYRESNTIDCRELPGLGLALKIRAACPTCGEPTVYFAAADHTWATPRPLCDGCLFDEAIRLDFPQVQLDKGSQLDQDLERFRLTHGLVARALEPLIRDFYERTPDDGPVQLGETSLPRKPRPLAKETWRWAVAQHGLGDFGAFGKLAKATPTDDDRFAPIFASVPARNRIAIEAGAGIVRSRFEVPAAELDSLGDVFFERLPPSFERGRCLATIDVATVLHRRPGRPNRTHAQLGRVDGQCFREKTALIR
jgi:hypothetical protein